MRSPVDLPRRSRLVIVVALTGLLIALTTAVASAILTTDPGPFTACLGVKTNKGLVYNVAAGSEPYAPCSRGDLQIAFSNAAGAQGEPGPAGPAGPQGPQGDPGDLSAVENFIAALEARIDGLETTVADSDGAVTSAIAALEARIDALEDQGGSGGSNDVDADGDGYTLADGDCNDADAGVNPGANEIAANGVDDDCNGFIDGASSIDADGDGYPGVTDGSDMAFDCNDSDPAIHPGAIEVVNGLDDDCDGYLGMFTGYSGPGGTAGVGVCQSGFQFEMGDGSLSLDVVGEITPTTEVENGLDDDCDGEVDEAA